MNFQNQYSYRVGFIILLIAISVLIIVQSVCFRPAKNPKADISTVTSKDKEIDFPSPTNRPTKNKPSAHGGDVTPPQPASPYLFDFNADETIEESYPSSMSASREWWVNSGAYMSMSEGKGHTSTGELSAADPWRLLYSEENPQDTDNGYHPQNIFRMPTRSVWLNARQILYFIVLKNNLSASPNRNESNGLLLFNRLQDNFNLYYAGVRVDGAAVIKKKIGGTYYTLAYMPGIYPGLYDHNTNPNLLPSNRWIGLRCEVVNRGSSSVSIKLYVDKGWTGEWMLVAEAVDNGIGGPAFTRPGYGGIRTDFMDVVFENFRFIKL